MHSGRTAGDEAVALLLEALCHGEGVLEHLLLVGLELRGVGLLQGARQARDGVVVGATLAMQMVSRCASTMKLI